MNMSSAWPAKKLLHSPSCCQDFTGCQDVDAIENLQIGLTNLEGQGHLNRWFCNVLYGFVFSCCCCETLIPSGKHGREVQFDAQGMHGEFLPKYDWPVHRFQNMDLLPCLQQFLQLFFDAEFLPISVKKNCCCSGFEWSRWWCIERGLIKTPCWCFFLRVLPFQWMARRCYDTSWPEKLLWGIYAQTWQCIRTKGKAWQSCEWFLQSLLPAFYGFQVLSGWAMCNPPAVKEWRLPYDRSSPGMHRAKTTSCLCAFPHWRSMVLDGFGMFWICCMQIRLNLNQDAQISSLQLLLCTLCIYVAWAMSWQGWTRWQDETVQVDIAYG